MEQNEKIVNHEKHRFTISKKIWGFILFACGCICVRFARFLSISTQRLTPAIHIPALSVPSICKLLSVLAGGTITVVSPLELIRTKMQSKPLTYKGDCLVYFVCKQTLQGADRWTRAALVFLFHCFDFAPQHKFKIPLHKHVDIFSTLVKYAPTSHLGMLHVFGSGPESIAINIWKTVLEIRLKPDAEWTSNFPDGFQTGTELPRLANLRRM